MRSLNHPHPPLLLLLLFFLICSKISGKTTKSQAELESEAKILSKYSLRWRSGLTSLLTDAGLRQFSAQLCLALPLNDRFRNARNDGLENWIRHLTDFLKRVGLLREAREKGPKWTKWINDLLDTLNKAGSPYTDKDKAHRKQLKKELTKSPDGLLHFETALFDDVQMAILLGDTDANPKRAKKWSKKGRSYLVKYKDALDEITWCIETECLNWLECDAGEKGKLTEGVMKAKAALNKVRMETLLLKAFWEPMDLDLTRYVEDDEVDKDYVAQVEEVQEVVTEIEAKEDPTPVTVDSLPKVPEAAGGMLEHLERHWKWYTSVALGLAALGGAYKFDLWPFKGGSKGVTAARPPAFPPKKEDTPTGTEEPESDLLDDFGWILLLLVVVVLVGGAYWWLQKDANSEEEEDEDGVDKLKDKKKKDGDKQEKNKDPKDGKRKNPQSREKRTKANSKVKRGNGDKKDLKQGVKKPGKGAKKPEKGVKKKAPTSGVPSSVIVSSNGSKASSSVASSGAQASSGAIVSRHAPKKRRSSLTPASSGARASSTAESSAESSE